MPLHVITGRATAGKTGELNARLFASLRRGETPVLILPSVADVRRASAEMSTKGPVGISVSTWQRWADGLWRLHGDGRRLVGEASRDAFVRLAIADVRPEALAEIATTPGFSAIIGRTVATMTALPRPGDPLPESMRAVALVCARYQQLIATAGLVENVEAWRWLARNAPEFAGTIGVNRFSHFDAPSMALLVGLSQVNEVVVALTWDEGFAPTRALDPLVGELTAVADTISRVDDATPPGELGELLTNIYTGSGGITSRC